MEPPESVLVANARKILADALAELQFLYNAQTEDVVSVTVTSRSGEARTLPVGRKNGVCLCSHLIAAGEKRTRRLKLELLRLVKSEGGDAAIELKNMNEE